MYDVSCDCARQVTKEMINFYDSIYDKAVSDTVTQDKKEAAASVLRGFHETVC